MGWGDRGYYVYMLASRSRVLYVGVTNDLQRRVLEHRNGAVEGFTKRYNIRRLVWFESGSDVMVAIEREKQIKGWRREKKVGLIEKGNLTWEDLAEGWCGGETGQQQERKADPSLRSG